MVTRIEALTPHPRITTDPAASSIVLRLRQYGAASVVCALLLALLLLAHALDSPYPVSPTTQLLVSVFLLLSVGLHLLLTRQRWYEITPDGLQFQKAFGRTATIAWKDMHEVRYLVGGAVPFSVKVHGGRAPISLGVSHEALPEWTSVCLSLMKLDCTSGGPLTAIRYPLAYGLAMLSAAAAILVTPIATLRALNDAPQSAYSLLPVFALTFAILHFCRRKLFWSAEGVTLRRGARTRRYDWREIHPAWRKGLLGTLRLDLKLDGHTMLRVRTTEWGAPRFIARLGLDPAIQHANDEPADAAWTPSAGLLFPAALALFLIAGGSQLHTSAKLLGEITMERLLASVGTEAQAQIIGGRLGSRGLHLEYRFVANGRYHRGVGLVPTSALKDGFLEPTLRVRYLAHQPDVSLPKGDVRVYYIFYYAIIAAFNGVVLIPLLALWDLQAAPFPFGLTPNRPAPRPSETQSWSAAFVQIQPSDVSIAGAES